MKKFNQLLRKFFKHYLTYPVWCKLHYTLANIVKSVITPHFLPIKKCVIAPRGFGKSVFTSLILPILSALLSDKKYILIISHSREKAAGFVKNIKDELEQNALLQKIFSYSKGKFWSSQELELIFNYKSDVTIKALGIGSNIRGERKGSQRPDLIILDDVESREIAFSRERSEKLWQWFTSDVIPAGDELMTDFVIVGTVITNLSFVNKIQQIPTFETFKFKAIERIYDESFVKKFENILKTEGRQAAEQFYMQNIETAKKAADVLWKEVWDLKTLLLKKAEIGSSAFLAEYQQESDSVNLKIFEPQKYIRLSRQAFENLLQSEKKDAKIFFAYDPTTGKESKKGCLAGIVVLVNIHGKVYIAESHGLVASIEKQLEFIQKLVQKYSKKIDAQAIVCVESNHLQHILADSLQKIVKNARILKVENMKNKFDRILRLQPAFESGRLIIVDEQTELENELSTFPHSQYVDVIDALELGFRYAEMGRFGAKAISSERAKYSNLYNCVKSHYSHFHGVRNWNGWTSKFRNLEKN